MKLEVNKTQTLFIFVLTLLVSSCGIQDAGEDKVEINPATTVGPQPSSNNEEPRDLNDIENTQLVYCESNNTCFSTNNEIIIDATMDNNANCIEGFNWHISADNMAIETSDDCNGVFKVTSISSQKIEIEAESFITTINSRIINIEYPNNTISIEISSQAYDLSGIVTIINHNNFPTKTFQICKKEICPLSQVIIKGLKKSNKMRIELTEDISLPLVWTLTTKSIRLK